MRNISSLSLLLAVVAFLPALSCEAQMAPVKDLNTLRSFPDIATKEQWQQRATEIRQQILVSSGLWPMPEKTPLHAKIFGKIERDGYSVEKVYFQSLPGFYVAGNLYRPLGKGSGPFPGILTPHGHWDHGRLEDTVLCSVPGRCINFAKQGMIAFSYDMVGFNDMHFPNTPTNMPFNDRHRSFLNNGPTALLWSITLMGLQTWDSVRALDFLAALPDVDKTRLACTGESGGGTQTFMLGAIDDRLAAQAPVVMVSHSMQGGCLCENMPGLRVEFSNMELAAAAAPRPQILVSDTRDWTKTTMTFEGPAIEHIYQLFGAPQNLRYVQFDFEHNYNQTSREAVYRWFDRWLLHQPDQPTPEASFQKEPDTNLVVFPGGKLPDDAISQKELVKYLIDMHRNELQKIAPKDAATLDSYKQLMEPAWKRTLQLQYIAEIAPPVKFGPIGTRGTSKSPIVILAQEAGENSPGLDGARARLAQQLVANGVEVEVAAWSNPPVNPEQTSLFFDTYNRTRLQERVNQLVGACAFLKKPSSNRTVVLVGLGDAGLCSLLAAPAADAVIADCDGLDVSNDQTLLTPDLFCPGIRNIDTFAGAPILAAPHPLIMFNVPANFPINGLSASYKALQAEENFQVNAKPLSDDEIVASVLALANLNSK